MRFGHCQAHKSSPGCPAWGTVFSVHPFGEEAMHEEQPEPLISWSATSQGMRPGSEHEHLGGGGVRRANCTHLSPEEDGVVEIPHLSIFRQI